tara:strand:+ start:84 stop:257 length:174 start_codon:yes stop_codon:yes gene_type:complete
MNVVWTDKECHKAFKDIGAMIGDLQKLIELTDKRLKLLEASQFRQPLVLTKEMEIKN